MKKQISIPILIETKATVTEDEDYFYLTFNKRDSKLFKNKGKVRLYIE